MDKKILVLPIFLFLFLGVVKAQVYRDWIFSDFNPNNYIFFSTVQINETQYFAIGCYDNGNITVDRYSKWGELYDRRSEFFNCSSVGNEVNLFFFGDDEVLFPLELENKSIYLAR